MQFDIDSSGEFADIFLMIRGILLTFPEIREQKNAKQTAYYDAYSAVCFLRSDKEKLTLALAKGAALLPKFPFLKGEGKIVRHLYFKNTRTVRTPTSSPGRAARPPGSRERWQRSRGRSGV